MSDLAYIGTLFMITPDRFEILLENENRNWNSTNK